MLAVGTALAVRRGERKLRGTRSRSHYGHVVNDWPRSVERSSRVVPGGSRAIRTEHNRLPPIISLWRLEATGHEAKTSSHRAPWCEVDPAIARPRSREIRSAQAFPAPMPSAVTGMQLTNSWSGTAPSRACHSAKRWSSGTECIWRPVISLRAPSTFVSGRCAILLTRRPTAGSSAPILQLEYGGSRA